MEINEIFTYIKVVWRELSQRKFKVAIAVTIASFAIMLVGMLRPANYSSGVTIYADNQNIIKPLLGTKASVTGVKQNRTAQVRDIIYSPRLLTQVINSVYGDNAFRTPQSKEEKISQLRKNIEVNGLSGNYIKIIYKDDSAEKTFQILNKIVELFIQNSTNSKRKESRNAFNFIEQQTESYKALLLNAETKLKTFQSNNFDGTESEVNSRIATLRATLEEMKIQIQESDTRIASLEKQLSGESKFASNDYESAVYHTKLKRLEQQKSELLLEYRDDYPAITKLNFQIEDIKQTITEVNNAEQTDTDIDSDFNPLYQELRSKLSFAKVEKQTLLNRLNSFNQLLTEAYERRIRIANNKAELSELTRDYSVFQLQYEDMLAKKEKARISMILDIQGQGVNYKLQEAAAYPTIPSGPRFLHFFIAAPIISITLIFMIFLAKALFDNRIRLSSQLNMLEQLPVLATLKHVVSLQEKSQRRKQNALLFVYSMIMAASYTLVAINHKYDGTLIQYLNLGAI